MTIEKTLTKTFLLISEFCMTIEKNLDRFKKVDLSEFCMTIKIIQTISFFLLTLERIGFRVGIVR